MNPSVQVTESTPDPKPWLRCDDAAKIIILNLNEISLDWSLHWYIRKVAADMQMHANKPYTSVGSVFYAMPNSAVADFYEMQEGFEDEYMDWVVSKDLMTNQKLRNLTMFAFLLARCEGLPDLSPLVLQEILPNMITLIKLESKYRKGLAGVNYLQYSLFLADRIKPGSLKKKPDQSNDGAQTA